MSIPLDRSTDARSPQPGEAHLDELLDAALADTFPASDPVSNLIAYAPPERYSATPNKIEGEKSN